VVVRELLRAGAGAVLNQVSRLALLPLPQCRLLLQLLPTTETANATALAANCQLHLLHIAIASFQRVESIPDSTFCALSMLDDPLPNSKAA
jgi:hypothetical protein